MPQLKNPVTGQVVSVAEGQETPYLQIEKPWTVVNEQSTPGFNTPITPESLKPETPIDLSPQEPDNTNYQGIISAGSALAGALTKPSQAQPNSLESLLAGMEAPQSAASAYESTYGTGPTGTEIANLETDKINAQKDFDLVQAEIAALNAEAKAAPIKLQQESTGRGITAGGLQPLQTARLRDIALRSLPLEGKLLAAQATLTNNTNLLTAAKAKFDKVFELRMADITNQYNFKKDQQDKIWDLLNKRETEQLQAQQIKDSQAFTLLQNNLNNAQAIAQSAIANGQADIAAQITALDPKSPTFMADLGRLQGQIVVKPEVNTTETIVDGRRALINSQTGEVIKDLGSATEWSDPYNLGGDLVQKNLQTGEVRVAVNVAAGGGGGDGGGGDGTDPQLYSGLSSKTATAVRAKVNKYASEPQVQNFATVQDGYNFSSSISDTTTNPADDQALIYSLAKALDPGSVVREGEYATAQKYAQSWVKAYGKKVTQAIAGTGFLSEEARKNIKATIKQKYESTKKTYDNLNKQYTQGINSLTGRDDGDRFLVDYVTPTSGTTPPVSNNSTEILNNLLQPAQVTPQPTKNKGILDKIWGFFTGK